MIGDVNRLVLIVFILATFALGALTNYTIEVRPYIRLPKEHWKCTGAEIINDDLSNTDCTVYKKNKEI